MKVETDELIKLIEAKRIEIENTRPKRGPEYNEKIDEYNALVDSYNGLVSQIKTMVQEYNQTVNSFNNCLEGVGG